MCCSFLFKSQMIQGGLQVQLGPGSQTGPQPIKEVDESLKLHIHQVPKRITQTEGLKVCLIPLVHSLKN